MYSIGNTIEGVKKALSNDFRIIQNWFHENLMVLNAKKCHYMCFGTSSENDEFTLDGIKLPNSCEEKILGVIIDKELKFDPQEYVQKSSAKVRSAKQNIPIILTLTTVR